MKRASRHTARVSPLAHAHDHPRLVASLQVDQNRAVALPFPPRPIIDAYYAQRLRRSRIPRCALDVTQQGVIADGHAKPPHQPFSWLPTGSVAEEGDDFGSPPRTTGADRSDVRQPLDEYGTATMGVAASPPRDLYLEPYRDTLDRQIPQSPLVAAVARDGSSAAAWANRVRKGVRRNVPVGGRPGDRSDFKAWDHTDRLCCFIKRIWAQPGQHQV